MRCSHVQACLIGVAFAVGSSSCASSYYREVTCHWLELEEAEGLEISALRVTTPPWEPCSGVNTPGYYRLHRPVYVVEFWNGDRGDPQLYLRALDGEGRHLAVQSPQFFGKPNAHLRGTGGLREDYDYRLLDRFAENYKPMFERIEFAVLDTEGRELGRESLRVVGKSGAKYRAYY